MQHSICIPVKAFLIFPSNNAVKCKQAQQSESSAELWARLGIQHTPQNCSAVQVSVLSVVLPTRASSLYTSTTLICSPGRPSTFQPLKSQPFQPPAQIPLVLKASPSAQHQKSQISGVSCYRTGSDQKLNQITFPAHTGLSDQRYPIPSSPKQHLMVTGTHSELSLKHPHAGQGTQDG